MRRYSLTIRKLILALSCTVVASLVERREVVRDDEGRVWLPAQRRAFLVAEWRRKDQAEVLRYLRDGCRVERECPTCRGSGRVIHSAFGRISPARAIESAPGDRSP